MKFACSHCGQRIEAEDEWAGQQVNCPTCKHGLRVPQSTDLRQGTATQCGEITFSCTKCGQCIVIEEAGAGQTVQCPKCGASLLVPTAKGQAAGEPSSPTPTQSEVRGSGTQSLGHEPPPVPAPVVSNAPPALPSTEARSGILNTAAKMSYPAFYNRVVKGGLSYISLLIDYGDFLYPDEGGFDDCWLSATDVLGCLFNNSYEEPDPKATVREKFGAIIEAMRERGSKIPPESQEALTLRAMCAFLGIVRDFARPGNVDRDAGSLNAAISNLAKLKQTLSPIEPDGRRKLEHYIDCAIKACQRQLVWCPSNQVQEVLPALDPSPPPPPTQSEAKHSEKRSSGDQPPPVVAPSIAIPPPLLPPAPEESRCFYCKHRLPRKVCGNRESQFYGKEVDVSHVCPHFLRNPSLDYYMAALGIVARGEDFPEKAASWFEAAIQGGLPQDDEVIARSHLASVYLDLAFKRTPEDSFASVFSDPLFLEGLKQKESAVKVDSEQGYRVFCDPVYKASLFRFDAC